MRSPCPQPIRQTIPRPATLRRRHRPRHPLRLSPRYRRAQALPELTNSSSNRLFPHRVKIIRPRRTHCGPAQCSPIPRSWRRSTTFTTTIKITPPSTRPPGSNLPRQNRAGIAIRTTAPATIGPATIPGWNRCSSPLHRDRCNGLQSKALLEHASRDASCFAASLESQPSFFYDERDLLLVDFPVPFHRGDGFFRHAVGKGFHIGQRRVGLTHGKA
jgi:hypothetical protein